MCVTPVALVISNLPIVAETVRGVLAGRYDVVSRSWSGWHHEPLPSRADLVVADITLGATTPSIPILAAALESSRVVVCSLHRNEVENYLVDARGVLKTADLPSLMAL